MCRPWHQRLHLVKIQDRCSRANRDWQELAKNFTMTSNSSVAPLSGDDRMPELDIIRGVALFGVLWMNLNDNVAFSVPGEVVRALPTAPVDRIVGLFTTWLVTRKAQALFSLLFGFGFAVLTQRASARGADATAIYLRRLTVLFVVGLVHLHFVFFGDILHAYAAMGFLLLLTRKWPDRWLLITGVSLAIGTLAAMSIWNNFIISPATQQAYAAARSAGMTMRWEAFQTADYAAYLRAFSHFAWQEIYSQPTGLALLGWILGRFLIGAWIYRKGWLQDTVRYAGGFRTWSKVLLLTGLLLAAIRPVLGLLKIKAPIPLQPLLSLNDLTSQLVLALGYGAGIVVLCQSATWRRRLDLFRAPGRMAFTNYLMQSLVFFAVLYGTGLGWLKYAGSTFCMVLAIIGFAGQIAFSQWYLARYRFGPAEWLWRSATYGRWQPLRTVSAAVQTIGKG
jgi:uncharacterized protein